MDSERMKPMEKPCEGPLEVFLFLLLGTGILLPWNAFLTAGDFFGHLYASFPFPFMLSLFYNVAAIATLLFAIWFSSKLGGFGTRLVLGFSIDLVALVAVPVIAILVQSAALSVWIVLAVTALTGAATAIGLAAGLGVAALFGGRSITAYMAGQGISGLVVAVLRVVTKVSIAQDNRGYRISALAYFGAAGVVVIACIVASIYLVRLPSVVRLVNAARIPSPSSETSDLIDREVRPVGEAETQKAKVGTVFRKLWLQSATVWGVFFVTLSLFPGVTSLIKVNHGEGGSSTSSSASQEKTWLDEWFQIIMISVFMVGDFVGRSAPSVMKLATPKTLWVLALARVVFFPAFALLAVGIWSWGSNVWAPVVMGAFALTNGYFGTLAMMYGPAPAAPHERDTAATIMSFSLNFGIFCASMFAILLLFFINGKFSI